MFNIHGCLATELQSLDRNQTEAYCSFSDLVRSPGHAEEGDSEEPMDVPPSHVFGVSSLSTPGRKDLETSTAF